MSDDVSYGTPSITTIEYRRLRSFGSYENEALGATAVVGADGPEATLEHLKAWVNEKLELAVDSREERSELWSQIRDARSDLGEINEKLDAAKARFERAKEFLAKHGVHADFSYAEDMPF